MIFLMSTNPQKISIGWLLLPFIWLFVALLWTSLKLFKSLTGRFKPKRIMFMAVSAAALPTIGLLLDSINQLTVRDVTLLIGLALVGFFYASRISFERSSQFLN